MLAVVLITVTRLLPRNAATTTTTMTMMRRRYSQFVNMVRHIHRHLGHPADASSVAKEVRSLLHSRGRRLWLCMCLRPERNVHLSKSSNCAPCWRRETIQRVDLFDFKTQFGSRIEKASGSVLTRASVVDVGRLYRCRREVCSSRAGSTKRRGSSRRASSCPRRWVAASLGPRDSSGEPIEAC